MKTTEITIAENATTQISIDFKQKAMEWLQAQGNKLPPKHQAQFLEMAQAFGLNPFKREIYAVGYGENWNIITGYEVYLKRAERIGKLDGWETTFDGSGENLSCTVVIYRKDWSHAFKHTVFYRECVNKNKDGKPNAVWAKMPTFMTKKVAVAQAFRLCFPDEFGGMPYTSDEISETEEIRNVTPAAEPAPKKQFIDKNEALEIGALLGEPEFTEEDKDYYRNICRSEGTEITLQKVKAELEKRRSIMGEN